MKVLFIPYPEGVLSHGIPLVALRRRLLGCKTECSFLVPKTRRRELQALGVEVLDIDHHEFRTEMRAYASFKPDVVIDDCSLTTACASKLAGIPRISIVRTGSFPGEKIRSSARQHSMGIDFQNFPDVTFLGLHQPESLGDLCQADFNIIPSIPSVEPLPDALTGDMRYLYAGPLIVEDHLVPNEASFASEPTRTEDFAALEQFLRMTTNRQLVYITFGSVAVDHVGYQIKQLISALCERGIAVVGNIGLDSVCAPELYFYARYLPMHKLCQRASLVVHHCGSGTYQYPLLHRKPSVIVGTGCYDREDVAMRLQELAVARYIPSPLATTPNLLKAIEQAINEPSTERAAQFVRIAREFDKITAGFDLAQVLDEVTETRNSSVSKSGGATHAS